MVRFLEGFGVVRQGLERDSTLFLFSYVSLFSDTRTHYLP
jgi:hypothetical protein